MALRRMWPENEVQRILEVEARTRFVVATSETSERYQSVRAGNSPAIGFG